MRRPDARHGLPVMATTQPWRADDDSPEIRCGDRSRSRDDALKRGPGSRRIWPARCPAGDRVAVVLRNEIEFLEVSLGIGQLGAIPVPVNCTGRAASSLPLSDSGATAAFVHRTWLRRRPSAQHADPADRVVPAPLREATNARRAAPNRPTGAGDWLAEQDDHVTRPPPHR